MSKIGFQDNTVVQIDNLKGQSVQYLQGCSCPYCSRCPYCGRPHYQPMPIPYWPNGGQPWPSPNPYIGDPPCFPTTTCQQQSPKSGSMIGFNE